MNSRVALGPSCFWVIFFALGGSNDGTVAGTTGAERAGFASSDESKHFFGVPRGEPQTVAAFAKQMG
jgi:hypothetical protein